ncbi:hypothetical protein U0035_09465 [Niabella yanshanensis]|uniref:Uncharacterized protein n=1 Tax=Niabella yanshanensis TaxID=577386 RepID=A0ABZ0WAQ1_9BACT|nr:hypothetical protein [Niabella yanshanensis]WQD40372.1 hypothetical protein U0035_09465 [Niabella yanshanensis]
MRITTVSLHSQLQNPYTISCNSGKHYFNEAFDALPGVHAKMVKLLKTKVFFRDHFQQQSQALPASVEKHIPG